jgi:hypothetical protein
MLCWAATPVRNLAMRLPALLLPMLLLLAAPASPPAARAEGGGASLLPRTVGDYRITVEPAPPRHAGEAKRQALRIRRGGHVLASVVEERVDLYGGPLTDLDPSDKRDVVPEPGDDVTGSGVPVLVVETYAGGAHCCTELVLFGLGPRLERLGRIDGGNYPIRFRKRPDGPGVVALVYDNTFAYWNASFADSVAPEVTLAFDPGHKAWRFASALMRQAAPDPESLKRDAATLHGDRAWTQSGDESVPPALWDRMLALVYAGNGPAARDFLAAAWAGPAGDRDGFWHDLVECQLRRSPYWPDVAALNGWPAAKPAADCPKD